MSGLGPGSEVAGHRIEAELSRGIAERRLLARQSSLDRPVELWVLDDGAAAGVRRTCRCRLRTPPSRGQTPAGSMMPASRDWRTTLQPPWISCVLVGSSMRRSARRT